MHIFLNEIKLANWRGLPFNGLHPVIHVITWITTHLPILERRKAELAWLVDL